MNKNLTKWDLEFIKQAKFISERSKDKNTKTGVVIVDNENTEIVSGYNKFPRGADDDTDQRRYERPTKYVWFEHAERSAIYKAARLGISVNGCKMYATYFPCVDCARAIIESGLTKLYTEKPDLNHKKWGDSWVDAMIMLKECGVEVIWTNEVTHYTGQYLENDKSWYLAEHCEENGVIGEHFFDTLKELGKYADKHDIDVKWEVKCLDCMDKGKVFQEATHPTHDNSRWVDCSCKEVKTPCGFGLAWTKPCDEKTLSGEMCEKHSKMKCVSCGGQATRECSETMGLVCGAPLCGTCNHRHSRF